MTAPDIAFPDGSVGGGRLAANLLHFGRVLRMAGLPVGPRAIVDAVRAVETVGPDNRGDFYWTLHAVFVHRRDHRPLFDQAFHVFWRNPRLLERMMQLALPELTVDAPPQDHRELNRRVAEALKPGREHKTRPPADEERIEIDAALTFSAREVLQEKDFEKMSAEEEAAARCAIARMTLPARTRPTRRFRWHPYGQYIDMRATLRATLRGGGAVLVRRRQRRRPPPIVALCDISGSMSRYSRILLHFLHAVTNDRDRMHSFTFGTRLTNVTRQLRQRDVDEALADVSAAVEDWSGGTRIGACLHAFNRDWSRRVLAQGAVVLVISDGLDRETAAGLSFEMERLHKSCTRLFWLNPLLRYDGYAPKTQGARAMIPHVDEFRPVHNLESLGDLTWALSSPAQPRLAAARHWSELETLS